MSAGRHEETAPEPTPLSEYEEAMARLTGELDDMTVRHDQAVDDVDSARASECETRWEIERITDEINALKVIMSNV